MRTLVLGAVVLAGCWSGGGGKPAAPPAAKDREVAVADTEPVVGRSTKTEPELAREQAIEQARAAGILGTAGAPPPPPGPPPGPLDKEAIRRAIRAHIKPISLCYEQRLIADASLQGTTQVLFTIGTDGSVTSATASGFDPDVDSCVADVVKTIRFPAPDGGGTMQVRYPFVFHAAS